MVTEYVTRPREQIAGILRAEKRYLSAAEIHERLGRAHAKVALSTVYRALERLQSKGEIVARVDEAGESTYVLCPGAHHHHAICRVCGRVEDVNCDAIGELAGALRAHHDFELEGHAMEFFGRCKTCR
jgi:Fur family ferric uptake transcriptional regulator